MTGRTGTLSSTFLPRRLAYTFLPYSRCSLASTACAVGSDAIPLQVRLRDHPGPAREAHCQHQPGVLRAREPSPGVLLRRRAGQLTMFFLSGLHATSSDAATRYLFVSSLSSLLHFHPNSVFPPSHDHRRHRPPTRPPNLQARPRGLLRRFPRDCRWAETAGGDQPPREGVQEGLQVREQERRGRARAADAEYGVEHGFEGGGGRGWCGGDGEGGGEEFVQEGAFTSSPLFPSQFLLLAAPFCLRGRTGTQCSQTSTDFVRSPFFCSSQRRKSTSTFSDSARRTRAAVHARFSSSSCTCF